MLVDEQKVDVKNFMFLFRKKFRNFCNKAPLLLSYSTTPYAVTIFKHRDGKSMIDDIGKELVLEHVFNYDKDVKENIKEIKNVLLEFYPTMIQSTKREIPYTADKLSQMVKEGKISSADLVNGKIEEPITVKWRIERVIITYDEILALNMEENKMYHFKLKVPVSRFLRLVRSDLEPHEAWNYFEKRSVCLGETKIRKS